MRNIFFISLFIIASCASLVPSQISSKKDAQKSNAIQLSCPKSLPGKSHFQPKDKRESNWLRASVLIGPSGVDRESLSKAPILRDWVPDSDYVFSEAVIFPSEKGSMLVCAYQSQVVISLILPVPYNQCKILNPGPGANHSTTAGVPHFRCMKKNKPVIIPPADELLIDMVQPNLQSIIVDFNLDSTKQVIVGDESLLKIVIIPQTGQIDLEGLKPGKTSITIKDTQGKSRYKYIVKIVPRGVPKDNIFDNSFCSFDFPYNWQCVLVEGSSFICRSEKSDSETANIPEEAVIIISAKVRDKKDNLNEYMAYLKQDGLTELNEHSWVVSEREGAESPNLYTRYLATVNEDLGIVISFSVARDKFQAYRQVIDKMISTLRVKKKQSNWRQEIINVEGVGLFEGHSQFYKRLNVHEIEMLEKIQ